VRVAGSKSVALIEWGMLVWLGPLKLGKIGFLRGKCPKMRDFLDTLLVSGDIDPSCPRYTHTLSLSLDQSIHPSSIMLLSPSVCPILHFRGCFDINFRERTEYSLLDRGQSTLRGCEARL
jgi:hypothetical protein